jgi:hypothetical protein
MMHRELAFDLFVETESAQATEGGLRVAMPDRVTIGSHPSNHIVLADPAVAPFHGTLEYLGARPFATASKFPGGVADDSPEARPFATSSNFLSARSAAGERPVARFTDTGNGHPPTDAPVAARLVATWRFHGLPATREGAALGAVVAGVRVMDAEVHELTPIMIGTTRVSIVARERFAFVSAFERNRRGGASRVVGTAAAERLAVAVARAARQRAPVVLQGPSRARAAVALEFAKERAKTGLFSVGAGPDAEQRLERAFTEASATEGVVFVDDADQLTPVAQAHFLRLLRGFEGTRVVIGTAQPLAALVAEGRFRRDLRDRLAVIVLELPSRAVEPPQSFAQAKAAVIDGFERSYAASVLTWSEGHVARAAKKSGLNRASLYRLLERLERAR